MRRIVKTVNVAAAMAALCCMAAVLAGCSSQVYSDMYTYEYPALPRDSVKVVAVGDSIAGSSLVIGQVMVGTNATTTWKQYDRVLTQAVAEAAGNGGNLLIVRQQNPGTWRHGAWADIARTTSPVASRGQGRTDISYASATVGQTVPLPTTSSQSSVSGGGSTLVHGSLKFSVGPTWYTSNIVTDYNGNSKSGVRGLALGVSFVSLSRGWYGFGLDIYGSHASVEGKDRFGRHETFGFTQLYVGPSLVLGGQLGRRVRIDGSFGLGLGLHFDSEDTEGGVAFRTTAGLEYMLSRKIGIGLEVVSLRLLLKKPDGFKLDDDEFYGFQQLTVLPGLRMYF